MQGERTATSNARHNYGVGPFKHVKIPIFSLKDKKISVLELKLKEPNESGNIDNPTSWTRAFIFRQNRLTASLCVHLESKRDPCGRDDLERKCQQMQDKVSQLEVC